MSKKKSNVVLDLSKSPDNSQNKELKNKYLQLRIDFDKNFAVGPFNFTPQLDKLQTVYLVYEMGKYPFFLSNKSEKVTKSRMGYTAFRKMKSLEKKNTSDEEIESQTSITISPANFRVRLSDSSNPSADSSNDSDSPDTTLSLSSDGWEIIAHLNYGLPNENDGLVWNYIVRLISDAYIHNGHFYTLYFLRISDIEKDLIKNGHYKHRDGKLYNQIVDSLHRIKLTAYSHQKGLYRKDNKSSVYGSEYTFSLITSLYFRGDKLPDGSLCDAVAVAIDPLILLNFKNNRFLLGLNQVRSKFSYYSSMSLLDRLTFLTYQAFLSKDFFYAYKFKFPFFVLIKYDNLCSFLGLKPLGLNNMKKSKISAQFESLFDELKEGEVIQEVLIDQFVNQRGVQCFNMFFVLKGIFVQNVLNQSGKDLKSKEEEVQNAYKDVSVSTAYFKKIRGLIHSQGLMDELFSTKYMEQRCKQDGEDQEKGITIEE